MQKSQEARGERHIALLLYEGFSNLCLANSVEPLRAANMLARKSLYSWQFLGLSGRAVTSSSGLPVHLGALSSHATGDYLFVMPSYGYHSHDTPECRQALRSASTRFEALVGLDTGSWLLASAGLLDGYKATSHWDILVSLAETFPEITVVESRHVIDGPRASCGGATTTLELLLDLIERHHGASLALEVAALFMYGERDPRLDSLIHTPTNQTVKAAAALMRRNVEAPLTIGGIATHLGISQRSLEQAFKNCANATPSKLYRSIRLNEARRRLEHTSESVSEIAQRCGYKDATAMTRAFKAEFGAPPTVIRRQAIGWVGIEVVA